MSFIHRSTCILSLGGLRGNKLIELVTKNKSNVNSLFLFSKTFQYQQQFLQKKHKKLDK